MSKEKDFAAIILAAGKGTRMKSAIPKVMHPVLGKPMVAWAVDAARKVGIEPISVVLGYQKDVVEAELRERFGDAIRFTHQKEQNGTGDAVRVGLEGLSDVKGRVVILYGDCPLLPEALLKEIVRRAEQTTSPLLLVTSFLEEPSGYGRIVRSSNGQVQKIVEHKDCTDAEKKIQEVNPGIYVVDSDFLRDSIAKLKTDNAQGELYLTDIVKMAAEVSMVESFAWPIEDLKGVNDLYELSLANRAMQKRVNKYWCKAGVNILDVDSVWIEADVEIEAGAVIEPNVYLKGQSKIGVQAKIGSSSVLENVEVFESANIKPMTVATDSVIGKEAQVGPFAHLRPKSRLGEKSKVGNFSETKNTTLAEGSKVNHLSYVGDGEIGKDVNIGAGTIFCNYDGFQKHKTILEEGVFIGSDSQLIAPVRVGRGSYVASGTTVTKDVPENSLALGRSKQENKIGYASKLRAQLQNKKA